MIINYVSGHECSDSLPWYKNKVSLVSNRDQFLNNEKKNMQKCQSGLRLGIWDMWTWLKRTKTKTNHEKSWSELLNEVHSKSKWN